MRDFFLQQTASAHTLLRYTHANHERKKNIPVFENYLKSQIATSNFKPL
jgi:hypothetical protein